MPNIKIRQQLNFLAVVIVGLIFALAVAYILLLARIRTQSERAVALHKAALNANELASATQYMSYNTSSYSLGHFENREEFTEHLREFDIAFAAIMTHRDVLTEDDLTNLNRIAETRDEYEQAALVLFGTTNRFFTADSEEERSAEQAQQKRDWDAQDLLGRRIDIVMSDLTFDLSFRAINADEEKAQTIQTANVVGIVLPLLVIGLSSFIIFVVRRSIAVPIELLLRATNKFATGDYSYRIVVKSKNEFGNLSDSFNKMAEAIQQQIDGVWQARQTLENTVVEYVGFIEGVAQGELTNRLAIQQGDKDDPMIRMGKNLNKMVDGLANLTQQLERAAESDRIARETLQATIADYMRFVESVATGDLTRRLMLDNSGSDQANNELIQLGENLNRMVGRLAEMASQTKEVGSSIAVAVAEILASTTQQLASITEQGATINQTSTTTTEVQTTVSETAERAEAVAQTARRSVEVSQRGQIAVQESVDGMQMIRHQVEGIAENILALSERTQQIGQIIDSVNDIAEQSKVLALNASIEAARAGEEGKSFAVVAMEVRNLAEQSREATEQVREILNEIQQATNTAVLATENGMKGVDEGQLRINAAGGVIQELAQVIQEAAQAAGQIATSTHQQTLGMDQLAVAMSSIQQASLQTSASVQQAERSAQSLHDMAQQMQQTVEQYQL